MRAFPGRILAAVAFVSTALAGPASVQDSQKLFQQAVEAQQKGDDATAIHDYRELLKNYPGAAEIHANLGVVLAHDSQFEQAIHEYETALKLSPGNEGIELNLALAYFKQGHWKEASTGLDRLHAARPDDMRTGLLLADADLHMNDPKRALTVLKPLEDAHPDSIDLERLMTDALLRTGQSKEALKRLHALAAATSDAGLYTLAAKTALQTNQFEVVNRDADAALAINPKAPGAWTLKGEALQYLLDNEGSLAALKRAVAQDPNDFDAELAFGSLQSVVRDLPGAEQHLKKALELRPDSPVAHYEYGKVENETGHPSEALADFLKATGSDPNWLPPHVSLAALYAKLHKPDDARREREIVDKLRVQEQKAQVDMASKPAR